MSVIDKQTASPQPNAQDIEDALIEGATRYFLECRQRIPYFSKKYFAYPGCWHLNKSGIGWDMARTPLNLFWAPFYVAISLSIIGFEKIGWRGLAKLLRKTPTGFTTNVQRRIRQLILSELLQRNQILADMNGAGSNSTASNSEALNSTAPEKPDRFRECLLAALEEKIESKTHHPVSHSEVFKTFDNLIAETLEQYNVTRTASSDITNVASSAVLGAFAFQKFTPGGLGLGFLFAALIAKKTSESNFVFGETIGRVYYSLFPPEPSLFLLILSTVGVMTFLAFFSAISGLISDPVQYWTKIHHHRLEKMINNLERDFISKSQSRFRPKDQYIARVLDIFDAVKSHLV